MTELSVVIPVYNSGDCLQELYRQITDALSSIIDYEIVFVNDNSKDDSFLQLKNICNKHEEVKAICLNKNMGQNYAILTGIHFSKGKYIVIMDDDLQHSPYDILKLYKKCTEGYAVCYGKFETKKQLIWKKLGSSLNGFIASLFGNKPFTLYLSPFKIITAHLAKQLCNFTEKTTYVDALIILHTSNIIQIPLSHHQRFSGKGNYSFIKSVSVFCDHIASYALSPLKSINYTGVISVICSIISSIYFFNASKVITETQLLLCMIAFFGGMILIAASLIGKYVRKEAKVNNDYSMYISDTFNLSTLQNLFNSIGDYELQNNILNK